MNDSTLPSTGSEAMLFYNRSLDNADSQHHKYMSWEDWVNLRPYVHVTGGLGHLEALMVLPRAARITRKALSVAMDILEVRAS